MINYAYYNGRYTPLEEMMIPALDRAFYFGDGVYDVTTYVNGRFFALDDHLVRLYSSCRMMDIDFKMSPAELTGIFEHLAELSEPDGDAMIYIQVSRGSGIRAHAYPDNAEPNLFVYIKSLQRPDVDKTVKLITEPDIRFELCNIKTLNLIPNIMASEKAKRAGCFEAVFYRGTMVTEGSHTSIMIIQDGTVIIPPLSRHILPSVTRKHICSLCEILLIPCEIRTFSLDELYGADEIIVGSSTNLIHRAQLLDGCPCGGKNVELFSRLAHAYYNIYITKGENL